MNIVSFETIGTEAWDEFCAASPEAWLRHASIFIEFAQTLGITTKNLSFAVRDNTGILAIVPLVMQGIDGTSKLEFAMGGTPTPFPAFRSGLSDEIRQQVFALIFKEIETRASSANVARLRTFIDPLSEPILDKKYVSNPLGAFNLHDTSIKTSIVDLKKTEDDVLSAIQSRQRRYIKAALKENYRVDFFDSQSFTGAISTAFEKLYEHAAGRIVGSPERWHMTWECMRRGYGFVILLQSPNEENYCAGHVVLTYKQRAYDLLSAIEPSHRDIRGIGPLIHWENMRYLKQRGFSHYEIGWLFPTTISEKVYTKKELAISHFKSLFGGEVFPFFRGELYYDQTFFEQHQKKLAEEYRLMYDTLENEKIDNL